MLTEEQVSKLRRLMELRAEKDATEAAAKQAAKDYQEQEDEIFDELNDGPVSRLSNVDLGPPWGKVSFQRRETYFSRIYDEHALQEWLEERAMVDEYSAPKFAKKRLNELVRDYIEQAQPMPPGVDWYASRGVTITRSKS